MQFHNLFSFLILEENRLLVKIIYIGLFTFLHIKSIVRPERMGNNTCKSIGRVLYMCGETLWILVYKCVSATFQNDRYTLSYSRDECAY